jgi:hypothetical protein
LRVMESRWHSWHETERRRNGDEKAATCGRA